MNRKIKILIVISGNSNAKSPFVLDQVEALEQSLLEFDFFMIKGNGVLGYLNNLNLLKSKLNSFQPDLIHAHYGLSGMLSVLQRKVPVITTFHGSDVNNKKERFFSFLANKLSYKSIYVSEKLAEIMHEKSAIILPCGVDMEVFYPIDKIEARSKMNLDVNKKYILFSSSFNNTVKNYGLAKEAIEIMDSEDVELIELKGYSRSEVALLMNSVDLVIMTSFTEGSPQFIKEAMATNTPIISVDVGDVSEVTKGTTGCYIVERNPQKIAVQIEKLLKENISSNGRSKIQHLDNKIIAEKLTEIYKSVKYKDEN
ncbi:glycosyltransferase [Lutimonas saemankumensis]|uniref:glycosyltransferase n=1 Tax=Lutimonas saemankumensis TaxID=483016 RepID=UPI001CD29760|nr:glycosyltransferase [Lutimonas saemankumensis]MCA0931064.1 glycosyltransferase [Lutimonas saemankumensis]